MGIFTSITQTPDGLEQNRWLSLETTNEQHHKLKCISSSQLKFLSSGKSLEHYYQKFISRVVKSSFDDSFRIGTIAHLAVLEPEKFEKSVKICDFDQRTNDYKEFRNSLAKYDSYQATDKHVELSHKFSELSNELVLADTKEQTKVVKEKLKKVEKELEAISKNAQPILTFTKNGGFINKDNEEMFLVKSEEMEMYRTFQHQFLRHKRLNVMMLDCIIEQTGVAKDPTTDLWMSLRGDARNERGYFIDPKTMAEELTRDSIERYTAQYQLPLQAAHYLETANLIDTSIEYTKFFFVMMSKKPPYEVALIQLDQESLEYGFRKRREILDKLSICEKTNKWPSFDYNNENYGLTISLPKWGFK